jgi:hypothetical protein
MDKSYGDLDKSYGELMTLLLKSRLRYGSETGFRAFVAESVRTLANDLREFGLDVSVSQTPSEGVAKRREWNQLKIGCE